MFYRVSHIEMYLLNCLWQIEIQMQAKICLKGLQVVLSWDYRIWVSSTNFLKSYIFWPQQPPTEIVPDISKNLDFLWLIPQKGVSIGHFGGRYDQILNQNQEVFWVNRVVEVAEASEAAEANEAAGVVKASKSILRSDWGHQSYPGSWIQLYFDLWNKICFW